MIDLLKMEVDEEADLDADGEMVHLRRLNDTEWVIRRWDKTGALWTTATIKRDDSDEYEYWVLPKHTHYDDENYSSSAGALRAAIAIPLSSGFDDVI